MGDKLPEPMGNMDDVIVPFLLVHGGHDLVDLQLHGGVVPLPPVEECIFTRGVGIEMVGVSHRHHAGVVFDEGLGYLMVSQ